MMVALLPFHDVSLSYGNDGGQEVTWAVEAEERRME